MGMKTTKAKRFLGTSCKTRKTRAKVGSNLIPNVTKQKNQNNMKEKSSKHNLFQ
jgi:hypothetical protein